MTDLFRLQEQFQDFILTGGSEIDESIVATKKLSVSTRLGIYRDAYTLRLIECLETNFPALYRYLGTKEFEILCRAYIETHPSHYRSIRWYGDKFADFLHHYYDKPFAFLAELADFEWNMTLSFDAADDERVRVEEVAAIPAEAWAGLQFKVHPSVQRVNYFWNVIPLWDCLVHEKELPELENNTKATPIVVWRALDYMNHFYSMSDDEAWALDALMQNLSFGELCDGLCHWIEPEQVGMRAASFLKGWIERGMLAELKIQ